MRYLLMLFPLFLCTCIHTQKAPGVRAPAAVYSSENLHFVSPLPKPELDFYKLKSRLASKGVATVQGALAELKAMAPDFFQTYTLAYESLSLQSASFLKPRVIMYSRRNHMVVTFNGEGYDGGSALEIMSFRNGKFEFREIHFKGEKEKIEYENGVLEGSSPTMTWTKPNSSRCTKCHGQPAKPIWETYFLWPGVFGTDDDTLFNIGRKTYKNEDYRTAFHRIGRFAQDFESDRYKKFLAFRKADKGRYGELEDYVETTEIIKGAEGEDSLEPNSGLTAMLTDYYLRTLATAILKKASAKNYRYLFWGLGSCRPLEDSPADLARRFANHFPESRRDEILGRWKAKERWMFEQMESSIRTDLEKISRIERLAKQKMAAPPETYKWERPVFDSVARSGRIAEFVSRPELERIVGLRSQIFRPEIFAAFGLVLEDLGFNEFPEGFGIRRHIQFADGATEISDLVTYLKPLFSEDEVREIEEKYSRTYIVGQDENSEMKIKHERCEEIAKKSREALM